KFVWQLIFLFFITLLIIFCFSLPSYGNFNGFSCSPIFVFPVFNIIVCAILVKCDSRSAEDFDGLMALFGFVYEDGEKETEERWRDEMSSDSEDDADAYFCDSDGYESEIEWTDDNDDDEDDDEKEEYDENLETRIEEFIAKVIRGWREELLLEKSQQQEKEY
ncbi:hypothetical protein Pfo_010279, partial [Paulownia fortunei]